MPTPSAVPSPLPPESAAPAAAAMPTLRLAQQLRREERADEAAWLYRDLAGEGGATAGAARLELARVRRGQGRFAEALDLHAAAIAAAGPEEATQARLGRLQVLRLLHRHADAEAEAAGLLAEARNEPEILLEAGRLAASREAHPLALARLELAFSAAPGRPETVGALLGTQLALGRLAQAEALLDALVAAEPAVARWRVKRAEAAEARGELDVAMGRWREVLDVEGNSLTAGLAVGRLLTEAGRWRDTRQVYLDLADVHPLAAEPRIHLAKLALRLGETGQALDWLTRARELRPEDDHGLSGDIARVYAENGRAAQARRYASQLLASRPESPGPRVTRAWIEELSGDLPRAVAILREALADFPQSFVIALKLARHLERRGEAPAALDAVRASVPDCYGLELARADVLFGLGEVDRAGAALDALALDYGARADLQKRLARLEVARGRVDQARQRWARLARLDRHVAGPPVNLQRLDRRHLPPGSPGEIRLFTRLRNQITRLPWLLDFYRAQGVDRFLIVDNGSNDGTRDYLLGRPDVHLWLTTDSYAEYGGGMRWLNELLAEHGAGHWCLTVDADEVLAYPHAERLGLKGLTRHLEAQGAEALHAFMLDMYPKGSIAEARCAPGEAPFAVCPLFDRAGYVAWPSPEFPFRLVFGGPMVRLLHEGRDDAVYLHKVPLVRWRPELRYTASTHHLFPVRLAAETGALLHFKYLSDLPEKAAVEASRKQYAQGGRRYTALKGLFDRDAGLSLACALSERFEDTTQLVRLGLVRSSPELDALVAAAAAGGGGLLPGWPTAAGPD